MKPHIKLTIDELRAHQALLQNMIHALEAYAQASEGPAPTASAQPVQSSPTQACAGRVAPAPSPRRPSGKGRGKGVQELVSWVAQRLSPASSKMIRDYIMNQFPNEAAHIGKSSYGSSLNGLAKRKVVKKDNGMWHWIGDGDLSAKEAAYREFRKEIEPAAEATPEAK